jgi:hypothetical protein
MYRIDIKKYGCVPPLFSIVIIYRINIEKYNYFPNIFSIYVIILKFVPNYVIFQNIPSFLLTWVLPCLPLLATCHMPFTGYNEQVL